MSNAKIRTHRYERANTGATLSSRPRTGALRAAPRHIPAASRGMRATAVRPHRFAVRAPRARAHAAVRVGRGALPGLHCTDRSGGPLAARVCPRGVRCLPALRRARARLPAGGVRALPCREAGGLLLQEARVLPELRRATHGRERAHLVEEVFGPRPVRQWVLSFPYPLRFLFASKPEAIGPVLGIVQRVIAGWLADQCRHRPRQRPVRRGDADPAFRQRAEPEHPLPHAVARRRVRGSHRAAAARTAPAPRPCAHHRAVDPAGSCHRAPGVSAPDAQRLARRGGRIGLPGRQRCRRRQHGWAADEFDHLPHRHRPRRWLQGRHAANAAR